MSLLVRTSACQARLVWVWQTTKPALVATDSMSATGWTKNSEVAFAEAYEHVHRPRPELGGPKNKAPHSDALGATAFPGCQKLFGSLDSHSQ